MNLYAVINLLFFCAYVYIGIKAFLLNPDSTLNRSFLYLCLAFSVWALGSTFVISAPSKDVARFWFKVSGFGFSTFPFFAVIFFQEGAKKNIKFPKYVIHTIFGACTLFFLYIDVTGDLFTTGFSRTIFGWQKSGSFAAWHDYLFIVYYIGSILGWTMIYFVSVRKYGTKEEKKMMYIISFSSFLTVLIATVTNSILPNFGVNFPTLGPISTVLWISGTWYAMKKYGFMQLPLDKIADDTIFAIEDAVVVADTAGKITLVNKSAKELLGYEERELFGESLYSILEPELHDFFRGLNFSDLSGEPVKNQFMYLVKKDKTFAPVNFSLAVLKERKKYFAGYVAIAHDMQKIMALQEEETVKNQELENAYVLLHQKKAVLQRTHEDTILNELEMVEIKRRINGCLVKQGKQAKYNIKGAAV